VVQYDHEYPAKSRVNKHFTWYTNPYPWSCSVGLVSDWMTSLTEISDDVREAVASALEACSRWCAIQIDIYFTLSSYIPRSAVSAVSAPKQAVDDAGYITNTGTARLAESSSFTDRTIKCVEDPAFTQRLRAAHANGRREVSTSRPESICRSQWNSSSTLSLELEAHSQRNQWRIYMTSCSRVRSH